MVLVGRQFWGGERRKCKVNKRYLVVQILLSDEKKLSLVVTLFLTQAPFVMGISFINVDFPYNWDMYSFF